MSLKMKSGRNWRRLGMKYNNTPVGIIPETWEIKKISEITEIVTDYVANGSFASLAENVMYKDTEDIAVLIRLVDFNNNFNGDFVFIDEHAYEFLKKSKLYGGEIIISNVGANVGTVFKCPKLKYKMSLAPNSIMVKFHGCNEFYYQWLRGYNGQQMLKSIVTGSAQPKFNKTNFKEMFVPVPPIEIQKQIASILSVLDDKIEQNNQINENLESQAQAIYQSMFISTHHETDRMGLLSELITVKYGKDHKKLNDGIYPVYGSGGIMRYVEKPIYEKESVLIPRKGSLNNVMYVDEPFWSVDTMFYTEMKMPNAAKYVFHFVKSKDLASLNAGSAVPSMTTDILNSMEVRIPSMERLAEFEELVAPLYRTIKGNICQSASLASLRDTLLPKLMNGEIDVSEVKI